MPHDIHRIAFAVTDVPATNGEKTSRNRWHQVGVSFLNRDGSETILLDALPLSGRIILQLPKRENADPTSQSPQPAAEERPLPL